LVLKLVADTIIRKFGHRVDVMMASERSPLQGIRLLITGLVTHWHAEGWLAIPSNAPK